MDPAALCRLATSCEEARQIDATHYEGRIRAKVGIFTARAQMAGEVLEAIPPRYLRVELEGTSSGLPGAFRGTAELHLTATGPETQGEYSFDLAVLGRLGTLGQPFLQVTAQRLAGTFAEKVSRQLSGAEG